MTKKILIILAIVIICLTVAKLNESLFGHSSVSSYIVDKVTKPVTDFYKKNMPEK